MFIMTHGQTHVKVRLRVFENEVLRKRFGPNRSSVRHD